MTAAETELLRFLVLMLVALVAFLWFLPKDRQ